MNAHLPINRVFWVITSSPIVINSTTYTPKWSQISLRWKATLRKRGNVWEATSTEDMIDALHTNRIDGMLECFYDKIQITITRRWSVEEMADALVEAS